MKVENAKSINISKAIHLLLVTVVVILLLMGCKQYNASQNNNDADSDVVVPPAFGWQTDEYCSTVNGAFYIDTRCSFRVATIGLPADELFRIYQPDSTPQLGEGQPSFLVVIVGEIAGVGPLTTHDSVRDYVGNRWPQQTVSEENTKISDVTVGGLAGIRLEFIDRNALENHAIQVYVNGPNSSVYYIFANFQSSSEEGLDAYRDEINNILERIAW